MRSLNGAAMYKRTPNMEAKITIGVTAYNKLDEIMASSLYNSNLSVHFCENSWNAKKPREPLEIISMLKYNKTLRGMLKKLPF
jgi:hypothetical protein